MGRQQYRLAKCAAVTLATRGKPVLNRPLALAPRGAAGDNGKMKRPNAPAVIAVTLALACCTMPALNGQSPKPTKHVIPKTLTEKQALAIIGKTELTGQGCGVAKWNGETWGLYVNAYKPMKLPWSPLSVETEARFVYRGEPAETHLIEFKGPGFCFRRSTKDDTKLILDNQAK
jgi:hypothetical protein